MEFLSFEMPLVKQSIKAEHYQANFLNYFSIFFKSKQSKPKYKSFPMILEEKNVLSGSISVKFEITLGRSCLFKKL